MTEIKDMTTEELRHILTLVNEGLRFAESKNAALLTLSLGIIFVGFSIGENTDSCVVLVLRYGFSALMLLTTGICLFSFYPRLLESSLLEKIIGKPQSCNVLYFGSIASLPDEEYQKNIIDIINNGKGLTGLQKAYVDQIRANSVVACIKFRLFSFSFMPTVLGLLVLAVLLMVTI